LQRLPIFGHLLVINRLGYIVICRTDLLIDKLFNSNLE
jgi:hypothetical protein